MIIIIAQCPPAVAVAQQEACVTERGPVSRPLPAKKGRKRLLCPSCRTECAVQGGAHPDPVRLSPPNHHQEWSLHEM
jgi:hypothetical protein